MNRAHPFLLIVPAFLVLAATVEGLCLQFRNGSYDWKAYLASAGDLIIRVAIGVLPLGLAASALTSVWDHRLFTMPLNEGWTWIVLFLGQDFCYYWMHRADHQVRWLWATHSVHHSPNDLNLSAAYRLGWTARLSVGPIFFAPLVAIGFPPLLVGAALAANLFYQFWLHATWIPRIGPLEWVLNTPSHHRVHHGSNPEYIDKNFGGVLIVFDRLFGTFAAERADIVIRYGLVEPVRTYNPVFIAWREWGAMLRDLLRSRSLREVLRALLAMPRPNGGATALGSR